MFNQNPAAAHRDPVLTHSLSPACIPGLDARRSPGLLAGNRLPSSPPPACSTSHPHGNGRHNGPPEFRPINNLQIGHGCRIEAGSSGGLWWPRPDPGVSQARVLLRLCPGSGFCAQCHTCTWDHPWACDAQRFLKAREEGQMSLQVPRGLPGRGCGHRPGAPRASWAALPGLRKVVPGLREAWEFRFLAWGGQRSPREATAIQLA